jgi:hypothetical protein
MRHCGVEIGQFEANLKLKMWLKMASKWLPDWLQIVQILSHTWSENIFGTRRLWKSSHQHLWGSNRHHLWESNHHHLWKGNHHHLWGRSHHHLWNSSHHLRGRPI